MKIHNNFSQLLRFSLIISLLSIVSFGQDSLEKDKKDDKQIAKAEAVIEKAINKLGGKTYRDVKTSVGEGRFSLLKSGRIVSFSSFIDVMVFPNKERTDFLERGSKNVQVNIGDKGWFFDELTDKFKDQNDIQIENFKRSIRSHYNYLLRGDWKGNAELSYVGKRRASLGKRNHVLKLKFEDEFEIEYEFSTDGLPMKTLYTTYKIVENERKPVKEENRYAQFIFENGVFSPFIVDHYIDETHLFRVNYKSMKYNKRIKDEIFVKPAKPKKLIKKLKL